MKAQLHWWRLQWPYGNAWGLQPEESLHLLLLFICFSEKWQLTLSCKKKKNLNVTCDCSIYSVCKLLTRFPINIKECESKWRCLIYTNYCTQIHYILYTNNINIAENVCYTYTNKHDVSLFLLSGCFNIHQCFGQVYWICNNICWRFRKSLCSIQSSVKSTAAVKVWENNSK